MDLSPCSVNQNTTSSNMTLLSSEDMKYYKPNEKILKFQYNEENNNQEEEEDDDEEDLKYRYKVS